MIKLEAVINQTNGEFIKINNRNSQTIKFKIDDRATIDSPSFGIISNTGELSFIDFSGEIKKAAENHILKNGMLVEIYLKDTISKCEKTIGYFMTKNWKYNINTKVASVSLVDELTELQDIKIPYRSFDHLFERDLSFEWLYRYLWNLTPSKYDFLDFDSLDNDTKNVLTYKKFEFVFWEEMSLWNAWDSLCVACFCHLYKDFNGKSVFKYIGGN